MRVGKKIFGAHFKYRTNGSMARDEAGGPFKRRRFLKLTNFLEQKREK